MEHELPAEQEVYKSSRLSSLVPPQRRFSKDAFKMLAHFGSVCSECFQNESIFSRFANPPIE